MKKHLKNYIPSKEIKDHTLVDMKNQDYQELINSDWYQTSRNLKPLVDTNTANDSFEPTLA